MKTLNKVLRDNSQHTELIKAVIKQLDLEGEDLLNALSDIRKHGISGGFNGFSYYSDTYKFAMDNRDQIVALLEEVADQLGEEVVTMVAGFGVFRNSPMDKDDRKQLYLYIGGGNPEQGTITNVMAWFAAEEVARMFED